MTELSLHNDFPATDNRMGSAAPETKDQKPYFSFGLIADIQYANKSNGFSSWRTMRYYQQSLLHLQQAIEEWNGQHPLPSFVLQLGDIIDSYNKDVGTSEQALELVLRGIKKAKMLFHHIWGNHELYNFNREFLRESKLNTSWMQDREQDKRSHDGKATNVDFYAYHFSPHSSFRFIIVDTYDLSVHGRSPSDPRCVKSWDLMNRFRNENSGSSAHMVTFNGGIGTEQLSWLNDILTYCDRHQEKVIMAGHAPIHPRAKRSLCLAWNYKDILRVIQSHQSVVCYFAGHDHDGGYYRDSHGIHHVTMQGVIESQPDSNAFGTVDVFEDRMVLHGKGRVKSRVLLFPIGEEYHRLPPHLSKEAK
ncbi:manganese-dependent ADP-ribose/CDP-alcohol diphosphatase-like [Pyxicephalus adspersus]|uniref:manganese-dependent ADP-ribose/CDP-alcohol diphosphatase-like n=1 Tax=Pyxicephalus adspersus TaxID=30357 RepID=UPI003B5BB185